ncbi:MAG TPA: adenylate/guanylate cyclase domain-containing protein [Candidatus Bathyarchaeia archaeon]|nr:adenylate/guanylate cyclase domain-containing protein [Candidatus Bathyarchaeia archaeon]
MTQVKANQIEYKLDDSVARIDEILSATDASYEELDYIPVRDLLTFTNGFYVNCSAVFVDIRKSSELTDFHKNRVLAKLYRAYISEVSAVMNGNSICAEINVVGDCVSGIFDTPKRTDIDIVFSTTAKIASLIKILNYKLKMKNITEIRVGIGAAWGRALMVKAGYKGSGINEVVWMGNVVSEASKLASNGNRESYDKQIMISPNFNYNLSDDNKKLLEWNSVRSCYHGNVVNKDMDDWYNQNCP